MKYNKSTQKTSFWKFLKENVIEIPIIQRDYAQGRKGKESLRKGFLADLKKALDDGKQEMKLDFVYGSKEEGRMNPLDGQQRLTTLWLLHWYLALMSGNLDEQTCDILKKFTYQTRISSRNFCQRLCDLNNFKSHTYCNIVDYITSQTWFYAAWKQDPTIQSMLRMLGGTRDDKMKENMDGIEQVFQCSYSCSITDKKCIYVQYWEKLTGNDCPIVFYYLTLNEFKLTDDLYIKMNARGEQLTNFENFKADLIGYITKQKNENSCPMDWEKLLDPTGGIPISMDTKWTDVFWTNRSADFKIDEIYFAFLNRFFWNALFMAKGNDDKYILDLGKGDENSTKENDNTSYKYLNNSDSGQNEYDSTISYEGLSVYKYLSGEIPLDFFNDLKIILDRYSEFLSSKPKLPEWLQCPWDTEFYFIPKYEKEKGKEIEVTDNSGNTILKVTHLTQVQRIVFFAVCKYFKEGDADENSLKRWMRIVWNIVSGEDRTGRLQIRNSESMRSAIERIDSLKSHDVYFSLAVLTPTEDSEFDKRLKEEIIKARWILHTNYYIKNSLWEETIIKAESSVFFKGSIRFLYQDANGNVNWNDFNKKWDKAKKYFDINGIKEDYKIQLTRALVIQCSSWKDQLLNEQIFNPNATTWKWILCSSKWFSPIHTILTAYDLKSIDSNEDLNDGDANTFILPLLDKLPYSEFINKEPDGRFRWYDRLGYYRPHGQNAIAFDWRNFHRNHLLTQNYYIIPENRIVGTDFFWGWDIVFKYHGFRFKWRTDNYIYLLEGDNCRIKDGTKNDNKDKYYCFQAPCTEEDFKDFRCGLKKLIQEAYTVHRSVNRVRNGVCLLSNPILRKQITPINKKQKQSKLFYKQSHFYHISKLKFMK